MSLSQLVAGNSLLRAIVIPTYRGYSRAVYRYPPPRVIANGIPKGGTHLLTTLLEAYPKMRFSGRTDTLSNYRTTPMSRPTFDHSDVDWQRLRQTLDRVPQGQFLMAHFPHAPGLGELMREMGFRHVLIIRDPRDVAVSDAAYMTSYHRHTHHEHFAALPDRDAAIMQVITGFRNPDGTVALESIGERAANYAAWLDDPDIMVCRFEDLVGSGGGGNGEAQLEVVESVARHIQRPLSDTQLHSVADRVWSPRSHTFRSGRIGGWRDVLTDEHRAAVKDVAGDLLVRLGYETGPDW
ncbi:MAG: sulfotransferase domain-containing protein [Gaiellales bacterium]